MGAARARQGRERMDSADGMPMNPDCPHPYGAMQRPLAVFRLNSSDLTRPMSTDSRSPDPTSPDPAKERTTVLATYPTRRDAEMAKDRLKSAGYGAFITADDAGGMHVEMQLTNGVKLIGLQGEAEDALALLDDAEMLPVSVDEPTRDASDTSGLGGTALLAFGLGLTTLGLYLWLGTTADPFASYLLAGPGLALALTGWIRRRRAANPKEV